MPWWLTNSFLVRPDAALPGATEIHSDHAPKTPASGCQYTCDLRREEIETCVETSNAYLLRHPGPSRRTTTQRTHRTTYWGRAHDSLQLVQLLCSRGKSD